MDHEQNVARGLDRDDLERDTFRVRAKEDDEVEVIALIRREQWHRTVLDHEANAVLTDPMSSG